MNLIVRRTDGYFQTNTKDNWRRRVEVEIGSYPISLDFRPRCSPRTSQLEQTEHK